VRIASKARFVTDYREVYMDRDDEDTQRATGPEEDDREDIRPARKGPIDLHDGEALQLFEG
jgi:hypothetical protein